MADVPNVRYINFVDTKLTLQFSATGSASAMLISPNDPAVDITGFRKISILAPPGLSLTCQMKMGQVGLSTLLASYDVPLDGKIHTFGVQGPQMMLSFSNGPANSTKQIQLMVYLRS